MKALSYLTVNLLVVCACAREVRGDGRMRLGPLMCEVLCLRTGSCTAIRILTQAYTKCSLVFGYKYKLNVAPEVLYRSMFRVMAQQVPCISRTCKCGEAAIMSRGGVCKCVLTGPRPKIFRWASLRGDSSQGEHGYLFAPQRPQIYLPWAGAVIQLREFPGTLKVRLILKTTIEKPGANCTGRYTISITTEQKAMSKLDKGILIKFELIFFNDRVDFGSSRSYQRTIHNFNNNFLDPVSISLQFNHLENTVRFVYFDRNSLLDFMHLPTTSTPLAIVVEFPAAKCMYRSVKIDNIVPICK